MLEPNDRCRLLESLRPPFGYELNCAIGTTFSLDLLTLLTVPLAFTLFDWEDEEGRPTVEPLAILEALRRYSDRISVFCQAGQIMIPRKDQLLYSHLEDSVFAVVVPNGQGVFHPKLWVLRFTAPDKPVFYRVLCLSRNLTFDRSWDTALVLDGELIDRKNAFATNHPLGNFVASLPNLETIRPLPDQVVKNIQRIEQELRRVQFEPPEGFSEISFWPLGIEGARRWPFNGRIDRMLIVSPFVSEDSLLRLSNQSDDNVLVSRLESLETLDQKCLKNFKRIYFLNPAADVEENEERKDPVEAEARLEGLHAKLYIVEEGWGARIWTGSANATNAAFNNNVEFMVGIVGKKSRFGVDAFLSQTKGTTSFADLLQEFTLSEHMTSIDPEQEKLDRLADDVRRGLVVTKLVAQVKTTEEQNIFKIQLHFLGDVTFKIPSEVSIKCWPITLRETAAVSLTRGSGPAAEFRQLSFEALTSFFAFELKATKGEKKTTRRFVLNVPLDGAPTDRRERILRSLLHNRNQVLRFILFILAEGSTDAHELLQEVRSTMTGESGNKVGGSGIELPLFESLVKALDRDPLKLDQIGRLVDDLKKTPEGKELLPEGFDLIWEPIWSARQRLKK